MKLSGEGRQKKMSPRELNEALKEAIAQANIAITRGKRALLMVENMPVVDSEEKVALWAEKVNPYKYMQEE